MERFFTLASGTPFHVNTVFVNRDSYIEAFHNRVRAHLRRSWPVGDLLDFQAPRANVMVVFGEGGMGKSALLRRIGNLTGEGLLEGLPDHRSVATIDFADVANTTFETVLLHLRACLGPLGRSWPAFDIAFSVYWERKHPGESLSAFVRRSSWLNRLTDGAGLADQMASTVDGLLGGVPVAGVGYRVANRIGQNAARSAAIRRLRRDLPAFDVLMNEPDPDQALGYLPVLLAYDFETIRRGEPALALCVLDTVEQVQRLPPERQGLEDLVSRMAYLLPNVFFVVGSRRPLLWHDPIRSVGLTYGGQARWPGLAGTGGSSDQFPLDGLTPADTDEYLRQRLTRDGAAAIPEPVRRRIAAAATGSPHYLELSAALYETMAARGDEPAPEVFGQPFPELVIRMMRDLSPRERDVLRAAALLEAFDTEIIRTVLPDVRGRDIDALLGRRFVRHDEAAWPPYRLHENLRAGVNACDRYSDDYWTDEERARHLGRAIGYLEGLVMAAWEGAAHPALPPGDRSRRLVAAFLLVLHAAAETATTPECLGTMAYMMRQLGHNQVLGSLPEYDDAAPAALAGLTAVARTSVRAGLPARDRTDQLQTLAGRLHDTPYAGYALIELGFHSWWVQLDAAERHFEQCVASAGRLAPSAQFGLASTALRRSRFDVVLARARAVDAHGMDALRIADLLGQVALHNGAFREAADHFTRAHRLAEHLEAPLFVARALRHLALATSWLDPAGALAAVARAWEANQFVDTEMGLVQCDMASAVAYTLSGRLDQADDHIRAARVRFDRIGALFELMPLEPAEVIVHLGHGRADEAMAVGERFAEAEISGAPLAPPVWLAVIGHWLQRPDWVDRAAVTWRDPAAALEGWQEPLRQVRTLR